MVWDSLHVYTSVRPFKLGSKWSQRRKTLSLRHCPLPFSFSTHLGSFHVHNSLSVMHIPLKDMQVHFSIYLLFSPQEFDCFSAWWLEWIEYFELIHQIWKWSLNWWECLTVNWTFLLWTFIVPKCKNTAPRNTDKEKRIHTTLSHHKYFHPLESSRHLSNRASLCSQSWIWQGRVIWKGLWEVLRAPMSCSRK